MWNWRKAGRRRSHVCSRQYDSKKEYVICLYVRLSIEDDDVSGSAFKTESGSITTQRALLHDYIKNRKEFQGCKVIEKCDDGFSGTHFDNRPQFTKMIELAKKGD